MGSTKMILRDLILAVILLEVASIPNPSGSWKNVKKFENAPQEPYLKLRIESELGIYEHAAIASDNPVCSQIGADILLADGNAVDAAIASLVCLGVLVPESMGLGGGFFATYYKRSTGQAFVLDAREAAPAAATQNMFMGDPELSAYGGLSVAVPGEMRGYRTLYERFGGSTPWKDLIAPSILLCEDGYVISSHLASSLAAKSQRIVDNPSMHVFLNPETGDVYAEGEVMTRPDLAKTLKVLQVEPDAVHTGSLSDDFLLDLQELGSIITRADMETYEPVWRDPYPIHLYNGNYTVYSVPPPGSGLILGFILNILENYQFSAQSLEQKHASLTMHRITEAFKFAYAKRTELGDMDYVDLSLLIADLTSEEVARETYEKITDDMTYQDPEHYGVHSYPAETHGTSHLSVVAPNGDSISITSTVNLYFGASIMSTATGIILNDEMDDFSSPNITNSFGLPPFPGNYIAPGKRPVSSMCPAVIINSEGDVVLAVGAAGGSQISTATAWSTIHNLWFRKNIKESVDAKRLHHQLFPMVLKYEQGFNESQLYDLEMLGHVTQRMSTAGSVVCGVARDDTGKLFANADYRKAGGVDGF